MEFLRLSLLFLHLGGLAALAGGLAVRLGGPREGRSMGNTVVLSSSLALLLTGAGLVPVDHALDRHLDDAKAGVKLAVLLVILALVLIDRRRRLSPRAFAAVGLLAAADVAVAVFWT